MTEEPIHFPVALILSRAALRFRPPVRVFASPAIYSQPQLDAAIALRTRLNHLAGPTAPNYDLTVAPLADVDAAITEIHRELTRGLGL